MKGKAVIVKKAVNPEQKIILLVEDHAEVNRLTAARLKKLGFEMLTALTGEEAVSIAKSALRIDLILMDINLGQGIDGIEAARQIFQERNLPILFLSNHTEAEIVSRAETVSPYGFVNKDAEGPILLAAIHVALRLYNAYIHLEQ